MYKTGKAQPTIRNNKHVSMIMVNPKTDHAQIRVIYDPSPYTKKTPTCQQDLDNIKQAEAKRERRRTKKGCGLTIDGLIMEKNIASTT